jgi:hypothetical protein
MTFRIPLTVAFLALAPFGALAETAEERQACMDDAFNVCGHAVPDRDRVESCLYENKDRVSAACRAVLDRYSTPPTEVTRIKATAPRRPRLP